jgi:hypothetical protein
VDGARLATAAAAGALGSWLDLRLGGGGLWAMGLTLLASLAPRRGGRGTAAATLAAMAGGLLPCLLLGAGTNTAAMAAMAAGMGAMVGGGL